MLTMPDEKKKWRTQEYLPWTFSQLWGILSSAPLSTGWNKKVVRRLSGRSYHRPARREKHIWMMAISLTADIPNKAKTYSDHKGCIDTGSRAEDVPLSNDCIHLKASSSDEFRAWNEILTIKLAFDNHAVSLQTCLEAPFRPSLDHASAPYNK